MFGYAGRLLRVNLTTGEFAGEPLNRELRRDYVGGRGFVAKIIFDELPAGTAPLSADNKVVVATGPFTGVYMPGSGRTHFGSLSPATGGYGDANMGGHFGPELKYAGYDALIIEGAAPRLSYLYINDDTVELRDATRYAGLGSLTTEALLKRELGEDFQVFTIGPAGENLVNFACVTHDFGRQAGRTGIGAVLGFKELKAVAVRGTRGIDLADPERVLEKGREMFRVCRSKPNSENWTEYGTAGIVDWVNDIGVFPTRNFSTSFFPGHEGINGKALKERIFVNHKGCFNCPIPCGKYSKVLRGEKEYHVEGPEYETLALVGGNCELDDIEDVAYANYLMDELGVDTISAGAVIAFAMECYQKGIITREQVGRDLAFGDVDSVAYLVDRIVHRKGIGEILAQGVRYAAEQFGGGSEQFAPHVKGLEWSGYESRSAPANMLTYMTSDIGAHHSRAWAVTYDIAMGRKSLEGKAAKVIELQHIRPTFDCLGLCRLHWVEVGFELEHYEDIMPAVTGEARTWDELMKVSERVWNLTRLISRKHLPDFDRRYDWPPQRFVEEPLPSGPYKGERVTPEQLVVLLDEYYRLRGWDERGLPTREKLAELGLEEAAYLV